MATLHFIVSSHFVMQCTLALGFRSFLQVLNKGPDVQPEPSPAVTRLKQQARAFQRTPFRTPPDLQALQECDRVADSPDRETPSSPSTRPSISAIEDLGKAVDIAEQQERNLFGGRLQIRVPGSQQAKTDMPPPRRLLRTFPAQQNHSQGRDSAKSSQPGPDGLHVLKSRHRPPSQVPPFISFATGITLIIGMLNVEP